MKKNTLVALALAIAAIIATAVTFASRNLRETKPTPVTVTPTPPAEKTKPAGDRSDAAEAAAETGALTIRYAAKTPDYIEEVFNAAKKSLDDLNYFRTGETPRKDGVTIYARAHGDVAITVDIDRRAETKDGATGEWIYASVRHGTFGNAEKSAGIVSKISQHLKKPE